MANYYTFDRNICFPDLGDYEAKTMFTGCDDGRVWLETAMVVHFVAYADAVRDLLGGQAYFDVMMKDMWEWWCFEGLAIAQEDEAASRADDAYNARRDEGDVK